MPTFTARIKTEGGRTPDSVSAALRELHAAGVPGDAHVTFTGAMGGWAIEARWEAEALGDPLPLPPTAAEQMAQDREALDLQARQEQAREAGIQHDGDPG